MIGAIADDYTGATDVAVAFRRAGLLSVVLFGLPDENVPLPPADAVVIALKTRTIDPQDAVDQSRQAAGWLRQRGATQLFFKFCSTFDSTPRGNIGPVADALADLVDARVTPIIPSSPQHERRQFMGHLFVGENLLSDSPMRHHPLTPMTDSFIPRVLRAQTDQQVTLLDHRTVQLGVEAVVHGLTDARLTGNRYVVVDAITEADLVTIGEALVDVPLITGAAGIAAGLGLAAARRREILGTADSPNADPVGDVPAVALAGSCSARTLEQIAVMQRQSPSYRVDALATPDAAALAAEALDWFDGLSEAGATLIYSSLPPDELRAVQDALGTERASEILETAMAAIAQGLVDRGIRRIVVAGGETSGAVVSALDFGGGLIGPEAAPGVPWIYTVGEPQLALLLKSGNFGDRDLLTTATHSGRDRKKS